MSFPVALFLGEFIIASPFLILIIIVAIIERRKDMDIKKSLIIDILKTCESIRSKGKDLSDIVLICEDGRGLEYEEVKR